MLKKQLLLRLRAYKGIAIVLALVAIVGSVSAASVFDWGSVEDKVAGMLASEVVSPAEEELGSVASPYMPQEVCFGDSCVSTVSVDFIDASTTIFAVASPFRMATTSASQVVLEDLGRLGLASPTTTVDLVRLVVDGAATTTYSVYCGAAENKYASSTVNTPIISSVTVSSTFMMENNMGAESTSGGVSTGSVAKITLKPEAPWLICKVNATAAGAFTETTNAFDGKGTVRFNLTR